MDELSLRPWMLSLIVASSATAINVLVGVPMAYLLARRRFPGRSLLEALVILPLILPPTVVGFLLMCLIGRSGLLGWLTGQTLMFSIPAAIIASSVVSFPLLVMPLRASFASIQTEFFEEARIAGITRSNLFFHVALPLARRGLIVGLLLSFARGLGEFGATLILVSTSERTRTLPIQIYIDAGPTNDFLAAWPAVLTLSLTSIAVILIANRLRWLDSER